MRLADAAATLRAGRPVTLRPRGRSMEPRISDGQEVTILPLGEGEELRRGDIVLARVNGHYYLHLVTALEARRVQIGNNRGRINGWTPRAAVYGRLE